jgi:hypothetical protein
MMMILNGRILILKMKTFIQLRKIMHYNYFSIDINMDNFENGKFAAGVTLYLINTHRPDLIIFGSKIGKYNFTTNPKNIVLFNQINILLLYPKIMIYLELEL